jgi:tetratricopeptide (TPR) repeat protein
VLNVAWSLLAQGYNLLGQSGKATEYLQKMLKLQADTKSPGFLSLGHLALSSAHLNSGDLNEAKVHAEQALNLGQTNHEKYCEAGAWIQLGRIIGKMEASRIDEAEEFMLNGLKILEDVETKPAYATGCFSLCELYLNSGKIEKGLEVLRRSEEMFSRMGMEYWLAQARNVLSAIHRSPTH